MRVFCPQLVERAKGASLVRVIWRAAGGDIYIRYDTILLVLRVSPRESHSSRCPVFLRPYYYY